MILVLEQMGIDASLIYCQHTFNVTVTDLAGQSTTQPLIFDASKVTLASADLWANTATLALKSIPSNATSVSVQYKNRQKRLGRMQQSAMTKQWQQLPLNGVKPALTKLIPTKAYLQRLLTITN